MDEENEILDEGQETVVESQEEVEYEADFQEDADDVEEDESEESQEVAEPEPPKQSKEENSQYAAARRKAEAELNSKNEMARQYGFNNIDEMFAAFENQKLQQKAEEYAYSNGITEEEAMERLKEKQRLDGLERRLMVSEQKENYFKQKAILKNEPFFDVLEQDIDKMVEQSNYSLAPDVAYKYIKGEKFDELIKQKEQTAVKNFKSQQKRGIESGSGAPAKTKEKIVFRSKEAKDWAEMRVKQGVYKNLKEAYDDYKKI
jgi:hypothetical protein